MQENPQKNLLKFGHVKYLLYLCSGFTEKCHM